MNLYVGIFMFAIGLISILFPKLIMKIDPLKDKYKINEKSDPVKNTRIIGVFYIVIGIIFYFLY